MAAHQRMNMWLGVAAAATLIRAAGENIGDWASEKHEKGHENTCVSISMKKAADLA